MVAASLRRHRRRKPVVDHDLASFTADQPDEAVERHRAVVRVAPDEVFCPAPRVVRVSERVDLVRHLIVILANLRLPTCATTVRPAGIFKALSDTRSPSSLTPPCSIMRCASVVLGVKPACFNN